MKIRLTIFAILAFYSIANAQIYTPSGVISGTSSNSNIGIGTSNPSAKLTIQAGPDGYPTPLKAISIIGPNSPANSNSAQELSWDFSSAGSASIRSYRGGSWDTYMQFLTNSELGGNFPQVRIHINQDGNIGIGTTTPASKLDVVGTIKSYEPSALSSVLNSFQLINERSGNVGNIIKNRLWTYRDGTIDSWLNSRIHDGISVDESFKTPKVDTRTWWERDPYDNIQSWGNASETYFTINKGNIGIGIINPNNKLDVNGTIHSKEVKVDMNGWSDFVFTKDYTLPTLQEVEKHIAEKGHLENIPSEEEVLKSGINLGEMNSKLLQKIEELTLYAIEQQKNTQKLTQIIEELTKRLEAVEKR
ncbi:hypothetical protein [Flavobacterium mesophilum]|uniref:hypothetical protein n=1 Tax=Flavobacterium mesophilum TaxID=3143495 RepID=UPI0031E10AE0